MKRLVAAALCAALATTPVSVSADLNDVLKDMLGDNIHVNSGGPVSTYNRGGFYGGSVYIRGHVTDINILNFTPPSFSSGCGGIDMFGGSFSMINAQQFVQLLRSVAQNAAAYAFQLALKNICEQCSTIVAGLQKAIQAMNEFTGNSCQLAQGIVNQGIESLGMKDVKGKQGDTITEGWNDAWEGFWGGLDQAVTALNTTTPAGNIYQERYVTNVTWQALKDGYDDSFTLPNSPSIREAIMSITGTLILDGPFDDADGNPSDSYQKIAGNRISFRDLVYGKEDAEVLRCIDDYIVCLEMAPRDYDVKGLVQHLEEAYAGAGPADPSSILFQLVNGTEAQKDTSRVALSTQLGTVGNLLIELAQVTPKGGTAPWFFFDQNKEYIAAELGELFVINAIAGVRQELFNEQYHTAFGEAWINGEFQTAAETVSEQMKTLRLSLPKLNATEFISLYNYHVNTSPFRN